MSKTVRAEKQEQPENPWGVTRTLRCGESARDLMGPDEYQECLQNALAKIVNLDDYRGR